MILASVIPYHHPRGPGHGRSPACIVRITDGARVLAEEAIPVGRLACKDHGAYPCAACEGKPKARGPAGLHFERVVGPAEIAEVVERVVALVRGHGAGALRVEEPTGAGVEADRGRSIAAALRVALAGTEDEGPGPLRDPSPSSPSVRSSRKAPAGYLESPGVDRAALSVGEAGGLESDHSTPDLTPAQAPKLARRVAGIDPGARHVAATVVEELRVESVGGAIERDRAIDDVGPDAATGRLIGGTEPVPRIGEGEPQNERTQVAHAAQPRTGETLAQVRHVAHFTHKLGRDVPLTRPKTIVPKDGRAPYVRTTRHEVTDEDVRGLIRELSGFLARHEVDEAMIETAAFAFDGAGAMLLRSNRIGGVIEGALIAAGLPVVSTSSKTWRAAAKKMAGQKANGPEVSPEAVSAGLSPASAVPPAQTGAATFFVGAGSRLALRPSYDAPLPEDERLLSQRCNTGETLAQGWKSAVLALIANMPTDLAADDREHILDASGCALLAFAPAPEVRPAPARTRAPRGQGKPRGNEGRKARQERERAALGCLGEVCRARGQRGHADECPIKVAQRAKVSERMKGNSNAAKGARA